MASRQQQRSPTGHLNDGTPIYAPIGVLPIDEVDQRVRCHLCGGWYRRLAPMLLLHRHGWSADEYREAFGLSRSQALQARDVPAQLAGVMRARIAADRRIQEGMKRGVELARAGEIQRRARIVHAERRIPEQRLRQLAADGRVLGTRRAAEFAARRRERARVLGHATLEAYYRARYVEDGARLVDLAAELGVAESAIRGDLRRFGLGPDRSRSVRWKA